MRLLNRHHYFIMVKKAVNDKYDTSTTTRPDMLAPAEFIIQCIHLLRQTQSTRALIALTMSTISTSGSMLAIDPVLEEFIRHASATYRLIQPHTACCCHALPDSATYGVEHSPSDRVYHLLSFSFCGWGPRVGFKAAPTVGSSGLLVA